MQLERVALRFFGEQRGSVIVSNCLTFTASNTKKLHWAELQMYQKYKRAAQTGLEDDDLCMIHPERLQTSWPSHSESVMLQGGLLSNLFFFSLGNLINKIKGSLWCGGFLETQQQQQQQLCGAEVGQR